MVEEQQDLITKATIAAQRLQDETKRYEEVLAKMQAFEARQILGGRTNGAEPMQREPSKEEKLDEELKTYWKGTALEGTFK
jgi:hypothetical protein